MKPTFHYANRGCHADGNPRKPVLSAAKDGVVGVRVFAVRATGYSSDSGLGHFLPIQPRQKRGEEDEREGNPRPEYAGKHRETLLHEDSNQEDIHKDHQADKRNRSLKGSGVVEFPKVDER